MPPKLVRSFDAEFKLKVVERSLQIGNRAAAREYSIDERCVRRWRAEKDKLSSMPKSKRANRGGLVQYPKLEEDLVAWIKSRRAAGLPVSTIEIRLQARLMAERMRFVSFKGGQSWFFRFMRRHHLHEPVFSTSDQNLPEDWISKKKEFLDFVTNVVNEKKFSHEQIITMNAVPFTFDCTLPRTTNQETGGKGSSPTPKKEKVSFTCVLACTASGKKLKPLLVFKRKTMPMNRFPPGVVVKVNLKGCMSEEIMMAWLKEVWMLQHGEVSQRQGLLVVDFIQSHLLESVKAACENAGASLAVIPSGLTKKLQPLDLSANGSFKLEMETRWEEWKSRGVQLSTNSGEIRKPTVCEVSKWVIASWKAVESSTIVSGFKEEGIISELSTSQDLDSRSDDSEHVEMHVSDDAVLGLYQSDNDSSDFDD